VTNYILVTIKLLHFPFLSTSSVHSMDNICLFYCFFTLFAGNPRVTPEVTRDVCLLARMMAANLYFSQIEDLMFEVLQKLCTVVFRV
jgi:hypothetical protein